MNLFDLVGRPDRSIVVGAGRAVARQTNVDGLSKRVVEFAPGTTLVVSNAHELTAFKVMNCDFGWSVVATTGGASVIVSLEGLSLRRERVVVAELRGLKTGSPNPLQLKWPASIAMIEVFDLKIEIKGAGVQLIVGPAVDMRGYVLPYAIGMGVEVGPGLRPHVLPSTKTDVYYVEQEHPRDWLSKYNHEGERPPMPADEILARYQVGSAVRLDTIESNSLDFIFSNHVFEHLANPIQVLRNWLARLKPGGAILGVTPDPRYTFDCRQAPTTLSEALAEEAAGGHEIERSKYDRWCRHTEPRHSPDALIKRGYSIHVNFFTPEGFRSMSDLLVERGLVRRSFIMSAPNNKDFAFALWKSEALTAAQ